MAFGKMFGWRSSRITMVFADECLSVRMRIAPRSRSLWFGRMFVVADDYRKDAFDLNAFTCRIFKVPPRQSD